MTDILMALGEFRFSTDTAAYNTLVHSYAYRWAQMERLKQRPAQQFIGLGEETLEISGVIYPHYRGGLGQIDRLAEAANTGRSQRLVDGQGRVWGLWIIENIQETHRYFLPNGAPRKIEFSLNIKRSGEEDGAVSNA